jgi:hypothetical protein
MRQRESRTAACNRHRVPTFYRVPVPVQINICHRLVFAVIWSLLFAAMPARAAEVAKPARIALVIGNSRYETAVGPLRNTVNDAKAMAKALRTLGFAVIEKSNVTRDELLSAMLQFRTKLRGAEVGLFYFAGHGISVAGANYLLPVKSGYSPEGVDATGLRLLAETKLFNVEQAVAEMTHAGVNCNLVILDACRSTPVARNPRTRDAAVPGGLVEMNPPAGSLIAFATDAGSTASDGDGISGLYTGQLTKHLLTPGLSIEQVFKRTRAGVMERSGGTQVPAEYSRLIGEDIFLAGLAPARPAEEPIPKGQPVPVPTLAQINKLAAAGDAVRCIEALRRYTRSHSASGLAAAPLATLLDQVKERLRDTKAAAQNAAPALATCDLIVSALSDCLPADHTQRASLTAKAHNRRGDALLLLNRADEALDSFNAASALTPDDPYILYNRGRAFLALERKEEAKADFTAAADAKFKKSGARKLALEALATWK